MRIVLREANAINRRKIGYTKKKEDEQYMAGWIIALISGALMSVQGVFNTEVTKTAGMWVSNGWVQFSAFLTCVAVWLFTGRDSIAALAKVQPRFMLVGGVIGAGITWTVIASMKQLGPARAVLLIVVSQILAAYLIELFGLFGVEQAQFEWRKAIGMALAIAGVMIFQWK